MATTTFQTPSSLYSTPASGWDVFLNFRGLDTRYSFTSQLYSALDRHGVRSFKDDSELHRGDVISQSLTQAIQESKTYVVVFSENFASSSWCLDQLVEILKWQKTMNRSIICVYDNIDPLVVRNQTGRFGKAIKKHEARNMFLKKDSTEHRAKMEKVNHWRLALREVCDFSRESIIADQRSGTNTIKEVIDKVLLLIKPMNLDVAKYPVGLDSRIEYLTSLMKSVTQGVARIGIHGMGGVGKTTLAKAVYNQNCYRFQGSCFLENVREASVSKRGLVCLQQQLINDVLKCKNINIDNVDQGIELIRARICSIRVLIVIDDLDDPRPLKFLEGPFASGSTTIITTRNEDLLDSVGVEIRYKVNELGDTESRQLFSQHAYGEHMPERYLELSKEIIKHVGGLPLALEVLGSSLFNKFEEELICIEKLRRVCIANVEKKLVLSFDALELVDPVLQDIFLDVACFFVGWNKEEVVRILKTWYKFVNPSIDILTKRCLLTTNDGDELGMHNLIRDMGREIVRKNSPDQPGKHSRLWVLKEICDVLKNDMGTEAIEGIYSQVAFEGDLFPTATFKRMTKLRFLYLKKVHLIGSYEQTFEELRWFCWDCCPLECLPSDFHLQKVVILALPRSKIRTMWEPNMVFEKLKTLDMKYSLDLTATPNFSRFPFLETLNFEHCKSLEEVHESIGSLSRLVSFNLCGCVKLRSLPNTIDNLSALSLNTDGCTSLEALLPKELRNIESLAELNARRPIAMKLLDSTGLSKNFELNLSEKENEYLDSPSYSALTPVTMKWDVFLSFGGMDTGDKLTDYLYTALDHHGLRTFRDDPVLQSGKVMSNTLLQAIQESKTFIVVLSENYVSSSWCLDELVEILNCHRETGRLVLPVFYNIEPSVLRHKSERFEKVIERHQIHYAGEMEKLNKWRCTLTYVSNISAICISETRSESEIINEIVDIILFEIKPKTLDVAKYPVGLDSRVNAIMPLLSSGTEGVHKFGIYGIAGVGKTSLAKALYNELLRGASFEGSCFLANVREVSNTALGQVTLQQQLIDDLFKPKSNFKVNTVLEGARFIQDRFHSMKVLVVIDDVDELEQYESLAGPFASGSVVIMTTRDEQLLHTIEVEPRCRYMVNKLDDAESLSLFTQHAFGNAKPNNTLMLYSKEILRHVGGVPLALELCGSYLSEKPESGWKYFINKLRRTSQSIIQKKLKISYYALKVDPFLQCIFLDIACFFIGRKKEEVVKILETCYSNVDQYIDILEKRCLITTDNKDKLEMHDLLRDMGREIAYNNSSEEPGKHRLWVSMDKNDVWTKQKGTESIEGIVFSNFDYQDDPRGVLFGMETFKRMSKLRFLYLENVNLSGSFVNTLDNLRWLCWDSCPLRSLPSDFNPQKLAILELPRSNMRTVWDLNMVSEVFLKLTTLNMKNSQYLATTPDFTKLPCLETLNLEGCESLEEVHISIGSLARLASLNLRGCVRLRSLPDSFCNLRALESLNVGGCSSLEELPEDLGNIESLTELNAEILNVPKLPDSIGRLSKLIKLRLRSNKNLKTLPATICNLRLLEILDISECEKLEILPDNVWELPRLREASSSGAMLNKTPEYKIKPDALSLQKMDLPKTDTPALQFLNL